MGGRWSLSHQPLVIEVLNSWRLDSTADTSCIQSASAGDAAFTREAVTSSPTGMGEETEYLSRANMNLAVG